MFFPAANLVLDSRNSATDDRLSSPELDRPRTMLICAPGVFGANGCGELPRLLRGWGEPPNTTGEWGYDPIEVDRTGAVGGPGFEGYGIGAVLKGSDGCVFMVLRLQECRRRMGEGGCCCSGWRRIPAPAQTQSV